MNAFLKIGLIVIGALLAVKFLPEMFAFGCLLAATLLGLAVIGIPVLATLCTGVLILTLLLAPLWVPVLLIVGIVALVRRTRRNGGASGVSLT